MSYNQNFYNKQRCQANNQFTFQGGLPPPPNLSTLPPSTTLMMPPPFLSAMTDQEFMRKWDNITENRTVKKPTYNIVSINTIQEQLKQMMHKLQELKDVQAYLDENVCDIGEQEWKEKMKKIEANKSFINGVLTKLDDTTLKSLRKVLAKRSNKRIRLKRLKLERKKERVELLKQREERSRSIDEQLQKFMDINMKAKQEIEMKAEADVVLREVVRKKHDAKKFIAKLEALVKLRKARQNTARGRGDQISEADTANFVDSIEKLRLLWLKKLSLYEKEEAELRVTLKEDSDSKMAKTSVTETVAQIIGSWKEILFGASDLMPQRDFRGDSNNFVFVRSQWDQFLNKEGTFLPIGWVIPGK